MEIDRDTGAVPSPGAGTGDAAASADPTVTPRARGADGGPWRLTLGATDANGAQAALSGEIARRKVGWSGAGSGVKPG